MTLSAHFQWWAHKRAVHSSTDHPDWPRCLSFRLHKPLSQAFFSARGYPFAKPPFASPQSVVHGSCNAQKQLKKVNGTSLAAQPSQRTKNPILGEECRYWNLDWISSFTPPSNFIGPRFVTLGWHVSGDGSDLSFYTLLGLGWIRAELGRKLFVENVRQMVFLMWWSSLIWNCIALGCGRQQGDYHVNLLTLLFAWVAQILPKKLICGF